jgi:hypothetical protein
MRLSAQARAMVLQGIDARHAKDALLTKAREIGCTVDGEYIICTSQEQAEALASWWLRRKMN